MIDSCRLARTHTAYGSLHALYSAFPRSANAPASSTGYRRSSIFGICAAVKPTTSTSSLSLNRQLKLWKLHKTRGKKGLRLVREGATAPPLAAAAAVTPAIPAKRCRGARRTAYGWFDTVGGCIEGAAHSRPAAPSRSTRTRLLLIALVSRE